MRWSRRTLALLAAVAVGLGVGLTVALVGRSAGPTSYIYKDAEKAFYIHWKGNGTGTLWGTYVQPQSNFQIGSETKVVTVKLQGSAASIESGGSSLLGVRRPDHLALNVNNGDTLLGGWYGRFRFTVGSLLEYENAAARVANRGAAITSAASRAVSEDLTDANRASTVSLNGDCLLYLSGTDVSVAEYGTAYPTLGEARASCGNLVSQYGDLGSGGSWSSTQVGANYPGEASLACEVANAQGTQFVIVADAGGKFYGSGLCSDLESSGTWYSVTNGG